MKKITIKQNEEKPIAVEVIAESIKNISEGIKKLRHSKLNDKALFLLIQHATSTRGFNSSRVGIGTIKDVIEGIESLEQTYLKKKL